MSVAQLSLLTDSSQKIGEHMRACETCFIALPTAATGAICTDCADHIEPARIAPSKPRRLRIIHSAMTVKRDRGLERIAV